MKIHIAVIFAISAFLSPTIKAEEAQKLLVATSKVTEIQQIKEEIRRQEVILRSLKARLASLESEDPQQEELIINLVGDRPVVMGSEVTLEEIELTLNKKAEVSASYPIIIRVDQSTPYSSIVEILELGQKAGLTNFAFATPKNQCEQCHAANRLRGD